MAVILITTVIVTYSTIRSSPVQNQPPILSAIDETNLAIKQVLGFAVGYYGSVLQITGNVSYAKEAAANYTRSGLLNIANMNPQWGTSLNLTSLTFQANWFTSISYNRGSITVNYDLAGLGIRGINYQISCELNVQIMNSSTSGQACLNITQDENEPLVTLGEQNFNFYTYNYASSTWGLTNPNSEPQTYANGTYLVNVPSGVNSTSYVVQVRDRRGIIVVASSFNGYNSALTWNCTAATTSAQTLYAHQETTTINGTSYYLLKNSSADASGTTLNASADSTGRKLMGKFVYNLTGVSSIPASTWTMNYRAWTDNTLSIIFDNSSSGNNGLGSSSFSWIHTTGSDSNRIMIVGVSVKTTGNEQVQSVSYGAQSLTFLRADSDPGGNIRSEIWYLVGPNTGSSTVTVNLSTSQRATGGSVTYSGISQTQPVLADSAGGGGSSSSPFGSITVSTSNSFLIGNLAVRQPGSSVPSVTSEGTGQTKRWDNATQYQSPSSNNRGHGSEMGPVTGSQTVSWGLSGSADWAVSMVALKPAPPSVHPNADVLIRHSDGTNTTMGTNVAPSANLTSTPTTLSGTYAWANYTVVNQTDYLEIDFYINATTAAPGTNVYFRIDDNATAISNQTGISNIFFLPPPPAVNMYSLSRQGTVVVELLQNGTMRWLGQNLQMTNSASPMPFPPVPVRSIHVNETINGVNGEVPFQMEDWSSGYRIPQGLTGNMSIFSSTTMLVFLATPNASRVTIWWNGSDTATQTPYAYTNRYFSDSPSSGIISNRITTLQIQGNFAVTSTVGTSSCTANFMRINTDSSIYGSLPSYVITNGTVRDIIHQEAEWPNGVPNCPDIYADIVLTLPANATYYTYQLSLMFVQSQQNRTISDLCPVWLTSLTGQVQTENGTSNGLPIVSNASDLFYNYSASTWTHHWSQAISGATGAGIMFTDSANQNLYILDSIKRVQTGALGASNTTQTISLLPVAKSPVSFNTTLDSRMQDIIWYGAIATFDATAPPIYNNSDQTGLWMIAEYPPTVVVTTQNYQ